MDPKRGDTVRWTDTRTRTGVVQIAHPDRWFVKVGPGALYDLRRPLWEASGEVIEREGYVACANSCGTLLPEPRSCEDDVEPVCEDCSRPRLKLVTR
jgi:hypothetical protein